MKYRNLILSLILHLGFMIVVWVGLPTVKRDFNKESAMVLTVVPISDITNVKVAAQPVTPKKPIEPQKPKPVEQPKVIEPTPVPSKPAEPPEVPKTPQEKPTTPATAIPKALQEEVGPTPPIMPVPEKIEPIPPVIPKVEAKKEIVPKKEKVMPPKTEQKVTKKKKDDAYSKTVMKSVEDKKKKTSPIVKQDAKSDLEKIFDDAEEDALSGESNKAFNDQMEMSISEIDAIRKQITDAWNPAAFQGSGQIMVVTVLLNVDRNGTIISIKPVLDKANTNPSYAAFVDSVVRAANKASPLQHLSAAKFHQWQEMELRFTSEDMMY